MKGLLSAKTLALLSVGGAGGGGTAYGVTRSYADWEVEALKTSIKIMDSEIEKNEKTIKDKDETIKKKDGEITNLKGQINTRDRDATQFINTMAHATSNRRRVDWCKWGSWGKNQGRAKHHYGNYNGKKWEILYDEWGCNKDGTY